MSLPLPLSIQRSQGTEKRQKGNVSTWRAVTCGVAIAVALCAVEAGRTKAGADFPPTGSLLQPPKLLGKLYDGVEWSAKNLEEKTDTVITPSDP